MSIRATQYAYRPWFPPAAAAAAPAGTAPDSPLPSHRLVFASAAVPACSTDTEPSDCDELTSANSSADDSAASQRSTTSSPPSPYDRSRENSLPPSDESLSFFGLFGSVLSLDAAARSRAVAQVQKHISAALAAVPYPPAGAASSAFLPPPPPLLTAHFPSLVRLAVEAPFKDVRDGFIEVIAMIADTDPRYANVVPAHSGACKLIPDHLLPSVDDSAPPADAAVAVPASPTASSAVDLYSSASELLVDLFLSTGRIGHFDRVLAFQPSFYSLWSATHDFLMTDSGPLAVSDRFYLGIIAASRFPSPYFISLLSSHFVSNQGDPSWLSSIHAAPKRMQAFSSLSTLLAYRPYTLQSAHIEQCLRDGGMSMSELVQALCILTTYHSASAFASALGINEEVDLGPLMQRVKESPSDSRSSSRRNSEAGQEQPQTSPAVATRRDSKGKIVSEAEFLRRVLSDGHVQAEERLDLHGEDDIQPHIFPEATQRPIDQLYATACATSTEQRQPASTAGAPSPCPQSSQRFFAYASDLSLGPAAFLPSRSTPLVSFSSFSFKEHASVTLNRYYPSFASLLLAEMEHLTALTTGHIGPYSPGELPQDTSPFRRAISLFVQRWLGMYHEDFNYSNIGLLLASPLQTFLLRVCEGREMTPSDWALSGFELADTEKVHVALLVMEAKRQVGLLYAVRAVAAHHAGDS